MSIKWNNRIWRFGVAVPLIFAVLLVSLGASSVGFHHWLHGDSVECALAHHSPEADASDEGSSEDQDHDSSDPLEPFCQAGHLLQASLEGPLLEQPRVLDSIVWRSVGFTSHSLRASCPTRAPPVLI